jgi:uncharacterized membrane protein
LPYANLQITHLLGPAWETFKRRPGLVIAMWIACAFLEASVGTETAETSVFDALLGLAIFFASGPLQGGYDLAMVRLLRGDDTVTFTDLFAGFSKFEHLFLVLLLVVVGTVLGVILLVIPGIVFALASWPAYLLVMEDDLNAIDALKASWKLTDGYRLQLFFVALVSLALLFAGLLALGFGLFVAGPLAQLMWLRAYEEMRAAKSDDAMAQAASLA